MDVFSAPDFSAHEQVVFSHDPETGLKAIIAIHSTRRGPALGGCRMWPYASEAEALTDVLRLSRGMSYKSALADMPLGGGKSVIIGNSRTEKTPDLMRAMGRAVDHLGGRYIVAEDVGTTMTDMSEIRSQTRHVTGLSPEQGGSGDPSPSTAWGVFLGIQEAVRFRLKTDSLKGLRVAVQGLGNVGQHLCHFLHDAGAHLTVCDIRPDIVEAVCQRYGATAVNVDDIYSVAADVFAPCALGAILNDVTLPLLRCSIVAGSANNQLALPRHGLALAERDILYAPDYAINAGGVINVGYEACAGAGGFDANKAKAHINRIAATMHSIFTLAQELGIATSQAADKLAEDRLLAPALPA